MRRSLVFSVLVMLFWACPTVLGQGTGATVTGRVLDSSDAIISGAKVEVISAETNVRYPSETNSEGIYTVVNLKPGAYRIEVSKQGFKTTVKPDVALHVQDVLAINFTLPLGSATESITVEGGAPLLATESPALGTVIDSAKILDLPLNGRNFVQLAQLIPGVQGSTPGSMPARRGRGSIGQNDPVSGATGMSANGSRDTQNRYFIDGVELMDYDGMTFAFSPSIDSLAEFKVETSSYSAESGGAPGGQINIVTKHGTNQLRGTVWEFNRNDALSQTRDAIANAGAAPPRLNRNQFGANVGGPVYIPNIYNGKDKTFFFFNWESGRQLQGSVPEPKLVPTAAQRAGDFSALRKADGTCFPAFKDPFNVGIDTTTDPTSGCPRNQIPASKLSPQAKVFMDPAFEPLPNAPPTSSSNFATPRGSSEPTQNNYNARVDHNFSSKDVLFGRYVFNDTYEASLPVWGHDTRNNLGRDQNIAINYVHIFGSGLINEGRFGWNRFSEVETSGASGDPNFDLANKMGISGVSKLPAEFGPPDITISGPDGAFSTFNLQRQIGPRNRSNALFQFNDSLSWQHRSHFLKFGVEIDRRQATFEQARTPRGLFVFNEPPLTNPAFYTGSALADFMLGYVRSGIVNARHTSTNLHNFWQVYFVNDDWKFSPRLTLNIGFRYDYFQPYTNAGDLYGTIEQVGFTIPANASVITPSCNLQVAGAPITVPCKASPNGRGIIAPDRKNFGPRLGFAWRPQFLGSDSVLRGGYGIYYTPDLSNAFFEGMSEGFQATGANLANGGSGNPILFNQDFTNATSGQFPFMGSVDPNLKSSYTQQWNLDLQHKLPGGIVLDLGYVGSKGTRLHVTFTDFNRPVTPCGGSSPCVGSVDSRRPTFPSRNFVRPVRGEKSVGNSIYHALQLKAEKRASHGLTLLTAYTYSKTMSGPGDIGGLVGGGFFIGNPQDIYNLQNERSVAGLDQTHRFVQTVVYDLPFFRNSAGLTGKALGGWQVSTIVSLQTGFPTFIGVNGNPDTTGTGVASRASVVPGQSPNLPGSQRTYQQWFNTAAFKPADPGQFGNTTRTNALRMPGSENVDFSIDKSFRIRETRKLEFRAEAFNLMNHFNPSFISASANQSVVPAVANLSVTSPSFGKISDGKQGGFTTRVIQLGLKLYF